jgi:hypothetical protein
LTKSKNRSKIVKIGLLAMKAVKRASKMDAKGHVEPGGVTGVAFFLNRRI